MLLLALAVAWAPPGRRAWADDAALPEPSGPTAAVIAAVAANDQDALAVVYDDPDVEPWLVAHALCVRGLHEEARAFVAADDREDLEPLVAYVRLQSRRPADRILWRQLLKLEDVLRADRWFDLLEYMEQNRADLDGKGVVTIRMQMLRGYARANLDQHEGAIDDYWAAAEKADALGWYRAAADSLQNCFVSAQALRRLEKMLACKVRLVAVQSRAGHRLECAAEMIDVGSVHGQMANYGQALEHFEHVLRQYGAELPSRLRTHVLVMSSIASESIGDFAKAQLLASQALDLAESDSSPQYRGLAHMALGTVAGQIGDEAESRRHLDAARSLLAQAGDTVGEADALGNLGWLEIQMGHLEAGQALMQDVLDRYEALDHPVMAARARSNIAYIVGQNGDLKTAIRGLGAALTEMERLHDRRGICDALAWIAEFHRQAGDVQKTLAYRRRQLDIAQETGSFQLEANALAGLASVYLDRKDHARALELAERAVSMQSLLFDRLPVTQAARARHLIADAAGTGLAAAVALGSVDHACRYLEENRAGALLTRLEGRRDLRSAVIKDKHKARESTARTETAIASRAYAAARESGKLGDVKAAFERLGAAKADLTAAIERIQLEGGIAADLLYPAPASRREIQAVLGKHEALVTYGEARERLVALVLLHEDAWIVDLCPVAALRKACADARTSGDRRPGGCNIARLRELVVEKLELPAAVDRVLVSPTGLLAYQPPTLLFPGLDVAFVSSGTLLTKLDRAPRRKTDQVLALGAPHYMHEVQDATNPDLIAVGPVMRGGGRLLPLPASKKEVEAIGDVVLVGRSASETRLRSMLDGDGRWLSVHLACHGLIDDERLSLSALALTPTADDDGMLTMIEICQLRIRARLVVLSACESGRGRYDAAEGLTGLTTAFLLAGAPRVLVSLWKVDDEATKALMIKFYELWNAKPAPGKGEATKSGKPISAARALREAQAHVRAQPKWKDPVHWAAWVLWGLPD